MSNALSIALQPPVGTSAAIKPALPTWQEQVSTLARFLESRAIAQELAAIRPEEAAAALPPPGESWRALDIRLAAIRLGFATRVRRVRAGVSTSVNSLFVGSDGELVILESGKAAPRTGHLLTADRAPSSVPTGTEKSWFLVRLSRLSPAMVLALVLSLGANLLALSSPLFSMAVYDRVIGTGSMTTLVSLIVGVVLAMGFELLLRRLRTRAMAEAGSRFGAAIGNAILARLFALPLAATEGAAISAHLARVRDLERVRDLLVGPLAQSLLDLPFVGIFLIGIFAVGGWLGLAPLAAVVAFAAISAIFVPRMRRRVTAVAVASAKRQELALEIVAKMRGLRAAGQRDRWHERFQEANRLAVRAAERHAASSSLIATLSQSLVMVGGLATMVVGISLVLENEITGGALMASMIMAWRLLQPLQGAFVAVTRLGQIAGSVRQINSLMQMPAENVDTGAAGPLPQISGQISLRRVTFRYGREVDPVLSNLTFDVAPGEIIAVVGRNGSGKSTLLKMIAGLHMPQMGTIRMDGCDIRQFDRRGLRQVVAMVPQVPHLFSGTIADNLRLAAPLATDEALWDALEAVGVRETVEALPHGLESRTDTVSMLSLGLMSGLALARAWVKQAPLVLIDEPAGGFDLEGDFAFTSAVQALKGRSTVFFVTHRRGHLAIADKVLIIDQGTLRHFGPADAVRGQITRGMI